MIDPGTILAITKLLQVGAGVLEAYLDSDGDMSEEQIKNRLEAEWGNQREELLAAYARRQARLTNPE